MELQINVHNSFCQILPRLGHDLNMALDSALSFGVEGAQFSALYMENKWDGKNHLWKPARQVFPSGFLLEVVGILRQHGVEPIINDLRTCPELINPPLKMLVKPWDHQVYVLQEAMKHPKGLIQASTGSGKSFCLASLWGTLNVPGVILTQRKELMHQLRGSFKRFLGVDAGIFGDGVWEKGPVTICMVQSLLRATDVKYAKLLKEFDDPDTESDKLIAARKIEIYNELVKAPSLVVVDECIPGSQKVLTKAGPMEIRKVAELYKDGIVIEVLSYNENGWYEYRPVTYSWRRPFKPYLRLYFDRQTVTCTPDHPLLTPRGYIEARKLKTWDRVIGLQGGDTESSDAVFHHAVTVDSPTSDGDFHVYDLEVEGNHNFVLGDRDYGVVAHNCHHAAASSTYHLLQLMENAYWRYGFSATAFGFRSDSKDYLIQASMGKVIAQVTTSDLVDKGVLVPTDIYGITLNHKGRHFPRTSYGEYVTKIITENDERNKIAIQIAMRMYKLGEPVLVAVQRVDHGRRLEKAFQYLVGEDKAKFVYGEDHSTYRDSTLKDFKNGKLPILVSTLVSEGFDAPSLKNVINTTGADSRIATLQLLGRGMRSCPGKSRARFFDIMDEGTKWLGAHTRARREIYTSERAFSYIETPSKDLTELLGSIS